MSDSIDITTAYQRALGAGATPYDFQRVVAEEGLPEVLDVPTGGGKTPAIMLGWLYRRLLHPDAGVRDATPTRLIWCMPLRTLTRQTADLARLWVDALDLTDSVDVHTLMGGQPVDIESLRVHPHRPAIVLSTIDMALSRALNRGYLASRFAWPIDFALFNSDCHWVFDEIQLMGVALTTSRQLHGLRDSLGTAKAHGSTWMSATVPEGSLNTIDAPKAPAPLPLSDRDRRDEQLKKRLDANKLLVCREVDDPKKFAAGLADIALAEHRPGTLTLVTVNTVDTAQQVAHRLGKAVAAQGGSAPDVVVVHSRFRAGDRDVALRRLLGDRPPGGLIAVCTQVVEAGIDVSATTLVTECAPWSSIVQRAGRCNRTGNDKDARLIVVKPVKPGPYTAGDIEEAWVAASGLHATLVSPTTLAEKTVRTGRRPPLTLRRKDLLDLFDTAPDLSGNDIDVSRFIREDRDLDVAIAWRSFDLDDLDSIGPRPSGVETCPVTITAAREFVRAPRPAFVQDALLSARDRRRASTAVWRHATLDDVRPGTTLVVPSSVGGYTPEAGFDPRSTAPVSPIPTVEAAHPAQDDDVSNADDRSTTDFAMVTLDRHLLDTQAAAIELCHLLRVDSDTAATIARAGRLHDLGKAHPAFQAALHSTLGSSLDTRSLVLAKSGRRSPLRYEDDQRRGFRHELMSVLVLIEQPDLASDGELDADLVTYLVAAHHGRIRLGLRALPHEPDDQVLGVRRGDHLDPVDLGDGLASAPSTVDLSLTLLGEHAGRPSWSARALGLLSEHGPFRLAWMEMLVRIADWRASGTPSAAVDDSTVATTSTPPLEAQR